MIAKLQDGDTLSEQRDTFITSTLDSLQQLGSESIPGGLFAFKPHLNPVELQAEIVAHTALPVPQRPAALGNNPTVAHTTAYKEELRLFIAYTSALAAWKTSIISAMSESMTFTLRHPTTGFSAITAQQLYQDVVALIPALSAKDLLRIQARTQVSFSGGSAGFQLQAAKKAADYMRLQLAGVPTPELTKIHHLNMALSTEPALHSAFNRYREKLPEGSYGTYAAAVAAIICAINNGTLESTAASLVAHYSKEEIDAMFAAATPKIAVISAKPTVAVAKPGKAPGAKQPKKALPKPPPDLTAEVAYCWYHGKHRGGGMACTTMANAPYTDAHRSANQQCVIDGVMGHA